MNLSRRIQPGAHPVARRAAFSAELAKERVSGVGLLARIVGVRPR
jgi:hypothetical protein